MSEPKITYKTHKVVQGDSLSSIAKKLWGNSAGWKKIADANALQAPYTIRAGQTLLIPVPVSPAIELTPNVALQLPVITPKMSFSIGFVIVAILGSLFLLNSRR